VGIYTQSNITSIFINNKYKNVTTTQYKAYVDIKQLSKLIRPMTLTFYYVSKPTINTSSYGQEAEPLHEKDHGLKPSNSFCDPYLASIYNIRNIWQIEKKCLASIRVCEKFDTLARIRVIHWYIVKLRLWPVLHDYLT
jgi:hypothetical protein